MVQINNLEENRILQHYEHLLYQIETKKHLYIRIVSVLGQSVLTHKHINKVGKYANTPDLGSFHVLKTTF